MKRRDRSEDVAAAIEVLGWTDISAEHKNTLGLWFGRPPVPLPGQEGMDVEHGICLLPDFGEDIRDAFMLVDALEQRGWYWEIGKSHVVSGLYTCRFYRRAYRLDMVFRLRFDDTGESIPLAVRRSALETARFERTNQTPEQEMTTEGTKT